MSHPTVSVQGFTEKNSIISLPSCKQGIVVTCVALPAIALVVISFLSTSTSIHFFTFIPPYASGIMLGGGFAVLGADVLFAFFSPCKKKIVKEQKVTVPQIKKEEPRTVKKGKALKTVREPPQKNETPSLAKKTHTIIREVGESSRGNTKPTTQRPLTSLSLLHAMAIFKNYTPELANHYVHEGTLIDFLEGIASHYPKEGSAHQKLCRLIERQVLIEEENYSKLLELYETWTKETSEEPFSFILALPTEKGKEYVLMQCTRDQIIDPDLLRKGLVELQEYVEKAKTGSFLGSIPKIFFALCAEQKKKYFLRHVLHKFLKSSETESFKGCQIIYQIGVLQGILAKYPDWKKDPHFYAWVASSLSYIKRAMTDLQLNDSPLSNEWKGAQAAFHILQHEWLSTSPPGPMSEVHPSEFSLLTFPGIHLSSPPIYPSVHKVTGALPEIQGGHSANRPPETYPSFQQKEDLALLIDWHRYFFMAYQQGEKSQEKLESEIAQFLFHLPPSTSLRGFLNALDDLEKNVFIQHVYEIANLCLTHHILLSREALHPARILALLKALDVLLKTAQTIPSTHLQGFCLNLYHLNIILGDCYLDLGPYQKELINLVRTLSHTDPRIDLTYLDSDSDNAKKLLHLWFSGSDPKKHPNPQIKATLRSDFEGKQVPKAVGNIRSLLLLIEAFMAPHRYLNYRNRFYKTREGYPEHMQGLQRHLKVHSADLVKNKSLLSINAEVYSDGRDYYVRYQIFPLELTIRPFIEFEPDHIMHESIGPPMSPYATLCMPFKNPDILIRLAEGMLSNITCTTVDQDGNFGSEVQDHHIKDFYWATPDGLKQSQYKVHADRFIFPHTTLEVSRDLQQMASGKDNRASNALYTFRRHLHLFQQETCGDDYRQVFRLFLFRIDLLIGELENNSQLAEETLGNFDEMFVLLEKHGDIKNWCFLYKVHADALSSLRNSTLDYSKREKMHALYTEKLMHWIETAEQGDPFLFKERAFLHLAILYQAAVLGYKEEECCALAKSLLVSKVQIEYLLATAPLEGQILFDFTERFCQALIEQIENKEISLDALLTYRLKGEQTTRTWERLSRGVYKSETIAIDLNTFQIARNNKMEGLLPRSIRERFKALFGEKALKKIYTYTYVETPCGKAWHVELKVKKTLYHLYINEGDPQFPLLYRQKSGRWEPLFHLFGDDPRLPADFSEGYIWGSAAASKISEDPHGQAIYEATISHGTLHSLHRFVGREKELVLDPSPDTHLARLETPKHFIMLQGPQGRTVTYLRGNLQYRWDAREQKYASTIYKGYFLVERCVEEWIAPSTQRGDHKEPFFAPTFTHYHILENQEGKGKLVLFCRPYKKLAIQKYVDGKETIYTHSLVPAEEAVSVWGKKGSIVFDLEVGSSLKSKRPSDYFYLTYLLYIQSKYGEALVYLDRAQAIWTATVLQESEKREQIKNWILSWADNTPNAIAFKMHMLLLEHSLLAATFPSTEQVLAYDAALLPHIMEYAENYMKCESEVDPFLRLSEETKEELRFLAPRAIHFIQQKIISGTLPSYLADVKEFYQRAPTAAEILQWSLDRAIKTLENKPLKKEEESPTIAPYTPVPLFDVSSWLAPMGEGEMHQQTKAKAEKLTQELRKVFNGDTLADQIGLGVADDLEKYAQKIETTYTLAEGASLHSLFAVLQEKETHLLKREKKLKTTLIYKFNSLPCSPSQVVEKRLKRQETIYDGLFQKARYCFGLGNFTSLVETGALAEGQVETLRQLLLEYEILRTDRQLVGRKKAAVQSLMQDPLNYILRDHCAALLQEWRIYDPEKHPYAPILLLIEDEENITVRNLQITHIHELLAHPDSCKHEAMSGGKTTLLRNLYSAIENKKGRLAGVVTYAPLMAMHHKEYSAFNSHALGSCAYPLYYNRNAPHDVTAIKLMLLFHLKALHTNGRIDQTTQAIISLSHTLTELLSNTEGAKKNAATIHALQKLLRFRSEHLSVYSDEIVEIFNPMKDYNYAVGLPQTLTREYYQPALTLTRLLATDPSLQTFREAIKQNELRHLTEGTFKAHIRALALALYNRYHLPFEREITLDYLTETHQNNPEKQEEVVQFYEKTVLSHSDPTIVLNMQMLHAYVGLLLSAMQFKMVGADFGRSKEDGISVKPYSFSAVCQESSQRSFVLATVMEACIDYLVCGVSVEGAKAYVEKLKGAALAELEKVESKEQTPTALQFKARFSLDLFTIQEEDYAKIIQKFESSFDLFEECLCEILLKNFHYYPDKIEGNAHFLPHLVAHFSGASGSPERMKTLPPAIHKHRDLIKQEGAIGSVFYALLKEFDDESDIIFRDPSIPIEKQLASLLKPGDSYADNTPFFPGKKGHEIVQSIARFAPHLSVFRLIDEDDDTSTWEQGEMRKGEEGIDLNQAVSIVPHKGVQGTNWTFVKGKKGIAGAGVQTSLTFYYQSLMRFRLLGKGQKALTLCDATLAERWSMVDALQNTSKLCKIIWTLSHNEAEVIKNLHYQANRKVIKALRASSKHTIKTRVTDIDALIAIISLPSFQLHHNSPLNAKLCGYPVLLKHPHYVLANLVESEKEMLITLKKDIEQLEISKEARELCVHVLDTHCTILDSDQLFMDVRDLPSLVPLHHSDQDAVEEIEVEMDQQQETAVEIEQSISLEVEAEIATQIENEAQNEATYQKHPNTEEGREWPDHSLTCPWYLRLHSYLSYELKDYAIDEIYFPGILISNYALGIFHEVPQAERLKELWVWGKPKKEACISPKAHIIITPTKEMYCQLGSVKESDFYFSSNEEERANALSWQPIPYQQALSLPLDSFSENQREAITKGYKKAEEHYKQKRSQQGRHWKQGTFQEIYNGNRSDITQATQREALKKADHIIAKNESYYNARAKEALFHSQSLIFKADLRDTKIPDSLPLEHHEQWVKKMALLKFLYVDAPFSKQEEAALRKWLSDFPIPVSTLLSRLTNYLNQFYPNTNHNNLLRILTSF